MKRLVVYLFGLLLVLMGCTTAGERARMRASLDSINHLNRTDQPFAIQDVEPYVRFFDNHGNPNDRLPITGSVLLIILENKIWKFENNRSEFPDLSRIGQADIVELINTPIEADGLFVWSSSEVNKMITRTDPVILEWDLTESL